MARHEQDREDLMSEAKTLVARAEIDAPDFATGIVFGFRRDGGCSVYLSADEAYHFNSAGQLRRAYVAGRLYKAERGRLAALTRHRTATEVQLLRHDLTDDETAAFVDRAARQLQLLGETLEHQQFQVRQTVPPDAHVVSQLEAWLAELDAIRIAETPHAR